MVGDGEHRVDGLGTPKYFVFCTGSRHGEV